jgi:hypothetical protein
MMEADRALVDRLWPEADKPSVTTDTGSTGQDGVPSVASDPGGANSTGNSRTPPMPRLPVVPICRMRRRLRRRANHDDRLAHPASMKRDVSADRHDTCGGDAMDADGTQDERGASGRRSRVVLIPRRWDQVRGAIPRATVAIKARTPGRSRISRNPLRGECRLIRLNLWSLPPAIFVAGGPWVRPSPGIPRALFNPGGRDHPPQPGRECAAGSRRRVKARARTSAV